MSENNSNTTKSAILGSIFVATGQIGAATAEAIAKKSKLTVLQLLIGRMLIHFIAATIWWNCWTPPNVKKWYGDKPHIGNVWIRGILLSMLAALFYYGIIRLPLGDLQCILYSAPLMVVFLGFIWLKEKLPNVYILIPSVILTVSGIILVSQPSFIYSTDSEHLPIDGIVAMLICAICWALCTLLIRTALTVHFLQLELVSGVCIILISIPLLSIINGPLLHNEYIGNLDVTSIAWQLDIYSVLAILVIGILGFCVVLCSIKGYQYAEATKVAYLEYIVIPISFLSQTFIFKDTPNKLEIIGAIMVLVGALLPFIEQLFQYFVCRMHTKELITDSEEQELTRFSNDM